MTPLGRQHHTCCADAGHPQPHDLEKPGKTRVMPVLHPRRTAATAGSACLSCHLGRGHRRGRRALRGCPTMSRTAVSFPSAASDNSLNSKRGRTHRNCSTQNVLFSSGTNGAGRIRRRADHPDLPPPSAAVSTLWPDSVPGPADRRGPGTCSGTSSSPSTYQAVVSVLLYTWSLVHLAAGKFHGKGGSHVRECDRSAQCDRAAPFVPEAGRLPLIVPATQPAKSPQLLNR
jgi:hypothetical protein